MVSIKNQLMNEELSEGIERVFRNLFRDYEQVDVLKRFTEGMGGGDVFLIRCTGTYGREAPSIVKIDKVDRIKYELQGYNRCIRNKMPSVAGIRGEFLPRKTDLGGLWYSFIGDGTFDFTSLLDYYETSSSELLQRILDKRLFKSLDAIWREVEPVYDMRLQTAYNTVLSPNLTVRWITIQPDQTPSTLTPANIHNHAYNTGDYICLKNFQIARLYDNNVALLTMPNSDFLPVNIRLENVPQNEGYLVGYNQLLPIYGFIASTRHHDMTKHVREAMEKGFDETAPHYHVSPFGNLPNPLEAIADILNISLDVYTACIHGDLHLQNVLVDFETDKPYLIDFMHAQKSHVLRDLLHLEMAFVTHVLPVELAKAGLGAQDITDLYARLHVAMTENKKVNVPAGLEKIYATLLTIRRTAKRYLYNSHKWDEYYYGLILYLMGALRFGDLDKKETAPVNKQVAFWGSAMALKLAQMPANEKLSYKEHPPPRSRAKSQPTRPKLRDPFTLYEIGLHNLLSQLGSQHPRYTEALSYDQQLRENIERSRRFRDTETRRSERAETIDQLNELSLATLGTSFNELCH